MTTVISISIIFYIIYLSILDYVSAIFQAECDEEDRQERVESFRRIKDFILRQRMKGVVKKNKYIEVNE